jgi:hypothetical protein
MLEASSDWPTLSALVQRVQIGYRTLFDKQRFAEHFLQSLSWNLGHNDLIHEGNSANSLANTDSDTTPDSNAISKIRAIAKMKAITLTQTSVGVDLCSAL